MTSKIFLVAILLLAAAIRLVGLSSFPSGFNADEAALGYNAYSLLLTGRDEHGTPWSVNLESFGDFKPALYAYLLIPIIRVLGLTEFAVRLPSALAGIISVGLIFLFVRELFSDPKYKYLPHIAALTLALSPWAVHFSRGSWEVNIATTCLLLALWQFVRWRSQGKIWHLIIFVTALIASMYTYQSARIIAPLLGLACLLAFFRSHLSKFRQLLVAIIFGGLLLIPLAHSVFTSDAASRFSGVGFLADEGPLNRVKEFRGQHGNTNSWVERLLHNRPVIYTIQFLKNYTDHFDGNFLFVNGDVIERSRVPETGLLYLTDFIFIALGVFYLIRFPTSNSRLIWIWLFIAPTAAALTFQTPHALRAQNMVIPLTILVSLGLFQTIIFFRKFGKILNILTILLLTVLYSYQSSRFLHQYFIHYPVTYPAAWEYGFSQVVDFVAQNQTNYDRVIITDRYDQPYILFLFYLRYPPDQFQYHHQLTVRDKFNFSTVREFGKFTFTSTDWAQIKDTRSALIVTAAGDLPPTGVNIIQTISFPNGQPAFNIVSN